MALASWFLGDRISDFKVRFGFTLEKQTSKLGWPWQRRNLGWGCKGNSAFEENEKTWQAGWSQLLKDPECLRKVLGSAVATSTGGGEKEERRWSSQTPLYKNLSFQRLDVFCCVLSKRSNYAQWQKTYESLSDMVVPRSTKWVKFLS